MLAAGVIALFAATNAGLEATPPAPIERVDIERVVLDPGLITVHLRNTGPEDVTIVLVNINDSTWPATISPDNVIGRLGTAVVTLHYPWVSGEAYEVALVTANAVVFHASIPVAFDTPRPTPSSVVRFALIGVYVGLVPVALGMLWLPLLRGAGRLTMLFLTALTAGILLILGVDTFVEALEQAGRVPSPFQGILVVAIGTTSTIALLAAIGARQRSAQRDPAVAPWHLALLIAVGIGLHNLGEGLAIGAAYSVGEFALGAFLVVGFILQNLTEGVAIIVPILRSGLPLARLALLALIAGAPAMVGTVVGAFSFAAVFATLFLAIGAGAIAAVLYEVVRLAMRDAGREHAPFVGLAGAACGALLLYVTGLLVK